MKPTLPPIIRDAERILADVYEATCRFARMHRYEVGADLRRDAMAVVRGAHRAYNERDRRQELVPELVRLVDNLKITMQLGCTLRAFSSLGQFEALARQAHALGAQCGGWSRQWKAPNRPESGARERAGARHDTEYPRRLGTSEARTP